MSQGLGARVCMGKKKLDDGEELSEAHADYSSSDERLFSNEPLELVQIQPQRKGALQSLSVGDLLAIITLIVLSAALLLEGYHKDFRDYSREIVALFAIVVGFLLGRKL
jgi:hypothetical protein